VVNWYIRGESVLPVFLVGAEVLLFVAKRFKIYFIAWLSKAVDETKMLHLYWLFKQQVFTLYFFTF
jgi:hypothetical protein